ncbi:hypothetical protein [Achromobacter anxifer]|uniref:hypothetical protein n=1 Tax=Achromobacter anxifer TaxID=1287737 RepID=UPI0023F6D1AF|nr:hypothetical protein [Achromobacter anxifer]MDF8361939.1 hypothetical protein [Achromobacter anxifer]
MALNASIPLQYQSPQIQSYTNALFDATRLRAAEQDVAEQQRMSTERNALADVLRQGQVFDAQGQLTPGGLGQVAQAAPSMVPAYAQMANQQTRLAQQDQRQNVQLAMQRQDWARQGIAASQTPDQARAYVQSGLRSGVLDAQTAQQLIGQIPADAAAYGQWRTGIARQLMTPAQIAELERGTYSAPVQTNQGFAQIDRNGNVRIPTGPNGQPLMPVTLDAAGQANVAGAKTTASETAKRDVERPTKAIEAKSALDSTASALDRMAEFANGLINDPALAGITGVRGMFPNMPGGNAANAQSRLNTLKSQIGFAVLQAMRDASKTGGALGAVSDAENKLLQNNIASLENIQDEAQLRQQLRQIVAWAQEAKGRLSGAYQQQYGDGQKPSAQPGGAAARPSLTDIFGN